MKVNSLLRTVLWIALALFLGAIVMGVLFPAGSNPLVARSKSLAARGRNLYRVYAQDELADNTWGGGRFPLVPMRHNLLNGFYWFVTLRNGLRIP